MDWLQFENEELALGNDIICGIDEAGRGPLAGPVYAAAVILPKGCVIDGINDSKKLSEKKREELFDIITHTALAYGIGSATEKEIDEINILQATFLAMRRAVADLNIKPDVALIDGNKTPGLKDIKERAIIKGDAKSANIAAASILAKVSRDRVMYEIDKEYPQYQFSRHKGYGTKLHYELLREYGISPVHRLSFLKKFTGER